MSDSSYNDRALQEGSDDVLPKPQIEIIVDGNHVFKPSMETYFVDDYESAQGEFTGKVVGSYCSCNTVTICTCLAVCTCESVCSCVSHTTSHSGGGSYTYCSCVPVH